MKDTLERAHGCHHELFSWKKDWRWPTKEQCVENRWGDQRQRIALYTWVRMAGRGHPVLIRAAEGWSKPQVPFWPRETLNLPLCVVRVKLPQRLSQYVGWLSPDEFAAIEPVNWAFKGTKMIRMVLEHHLRRGLPEFLKETNGRT